MNTEKDHGGTVTRIREMFNQARAFCLASALLRTTNGNDRYPIDDSDRISLYLVATTNLAFSIELFLKCLILIETQKPTTGHDLGVLYSKLSPNTQSKIESEFNKLYLNSAALKTLPDKAMKLHTIQEVLETNSNTFEKYRYFYERGLKHGQGNMGLGEIAQALQIVISQIDPTATTFRYQKE